MINGAPIYVEVTNERWTAVGARTFRAAWLYKILEVGGGVSNTVTPGWYDFNVVREGLKIYTTLEPHQE